MLARTLVALCAAALLIPAVASHARADSNTGTVRGYVYLENTKQPVCGVRVTAEANNQPTQTTYTDKRGYFVFISRFPGIVQVAADDPSPRAKAYADVHPALLTEPVLYVSSRHKSRHRCAT
jgi:phosphatidate phosphatase APP1